MVARDHPERPDHVKCPGDAHHAVESQLSACRDVVEQIGDRVDDRADARPEWHEVRGEGDQQVGFVGFDVAAIGADVKTRDFAAAEPNEDHVREFVAEDVEVEEEGLEEARPKPADHQQASCGEIPEGLGLPEPLLDGGVGKAGEKCPSGNSTDGQKHQADHPTEETFEDRDIIQFIGHIGGGDGRLNGLHLASAAAAIRLFVSPAVGRSDGAFQGHAIAPLLIQRALFPGSGAGLRHNSEEFLFRKS